MLFHLFFPNNTILLWFFYFFWIVDLYVLILGVISPMFNPAAEMAMSIGIPTKETKARTETRSVSAEDKISKCLI